MASGSGEGASALTAALSALRLADIEELPRQAALTVADEWLYYLLLDEDSDFDAAEQRLGLPLFVKPACAGSSSVSNSR